MRQNGFSMMELCFCAVGFLILAGAASIYVPSLMQASREERALSETASLGGLVSQYRLEVGSYPASLLELTKENGQYGPWISRMPTDAMNKGASYQYQHSDTKFIVFSVGANGSAESSLETGLSGDDVGFSGR